MNPEFEEACASYSSDDWDSPYIGGNMVDGLEKLAKLSTSPKYQHPPTPKKEKKRKQPTCVFLTNPLYSQLISRSFHLINSYISGLQQHYPEFIFPCIMGDPNYSIYIEEIGNSSVNNTTDDPYTRKQMPLAAFTLTTINKSYKLNALATGRIFQNNVQTKWIVVELHGQVLALRANEVDPEEMKYFESVRGDYFPCKVVEMPLFEQYGAVAIHLGDVRHFQRGHYFGTGRAGACESSGVSDPRPTSNEESIASGVSAINIRSTTGTEEFPREKDARHYQRGYYYGTISNEKSIASGVSAINIRSTTGTEQFPLEKEFEKEVEKEAEKEATILSRVQGWSSAYILTHELEAYDIGEMLAALT
ncbi:hypothetical protein BJ875DRAFT_438949 [Amylocarpus encephaloides]|uniref:Uncharacterized protein n=1 Tax=Amylocarpus encephaloides TaxID=45428 RepID=A0A9P7YNL6_9HELO|nr:hypothetical protein BJ875DRAFT_438949 [Amylocarpus encephaloides]